MKKLSIFLLSIICLIVFSISTCYAKEYIGEIVKMNASRVEINVKGAGKRSFQMTKLSRVSLGGGIATVPRLPVHSKVRVVEKNNKVELIIVEEVPK